MSIIFCEKHSIRWDSDLLSDCQRCEEEMWAEEDARNPQPECKICGQHPEACLCDFGVSP